MAEVLTAQGATGAGYVASERIHAMLGGRQGTLVIQHGGLADGDDQSTIGTVLRTRARRASPGCPVTPLRPVRVS
ncbi:DUF3224 domain-containing protein [Plantactinospora soyae]|uniref:DUF3224 domain-containing protein n=1 Tax=Plantactinospora soyae TaxID=1544732 RepID=UPI00384F2FFF